MAGSASEAIILGIETSCDETAAAIVQGGRRVLANVVHSQVEQHRPHGGVVPEIACRSHIELLPGIVRQALGEAGLGWDKVAAVAATRGPGLASSLLIGWSAAKGLAWSLQRPLIAVNHIEAHIHSVFLDPEAPNPSETEPLVALVVSGGHTSLFRGEVGGGFRLVGRTIDDAAGEALDKAAKMLGLGYPGGPEIQRVARFPQAGDAYEEFPAGSEVWKDFPLGTVRPGSAPLGDLRAELCFSFSGLKTSLRQRLMAFEGKPSERQVARLAALYQEAVVEALVRRCDEALRPSDRYLAVGGGVSANARLRERLHELCARRGVTLLLSPLRYCGDNAAMIAGVAGMRPIGVFDASGLQDDVLPLYAEYSKFT